MLSEAEHLPVAMTHFLTGSRRQATFLDQATAQVVLDKIERLERRFAVALRQGNMVRISQLMAEAHHIGHHLLALRRSQEGQPTSSAAVKTNPKDGVWEGSSTIVLRALPPSSES